MPFEVIRLSKEKVSGPVAAASLLALLLAAGCSVEPSSGPASAVSTPALYGPPTGVASPAIPRARPAEGAAEDWTRAPFSCVQTELSPGTLYHASGKHFNCFTHLADYGLGAPAFAAFNTPTGPKIYTNGQPTDVRWVEENWVLVWFARAKGWTNWDSPWVVYLQHRPTAVQLDPDGLHLEFKEAPGDVVLFPLYGYEKPSPAGADYLATHNLPSNKIHTWDWFKAIPREPLMRVKYWASATREFPIYCQDSFSVDRAKDSVTIRQRFQWHSIEDDWHTRHLKVAPLSPPLALASMDKQFPVQFSKTVMDFGLPTPYGPYMGVEKVDSFDATFHVLRYVNETEAYDPPQTTNHPSVQAALDRLQAAAREKFRAPDKYLYDEGGLENFCSAILGDAWYAKGLPYYDDGTRANALGGLRKYFHEDVLVTNRFQLRELPGGSGRTCYILEGPGIGTWGALGDAGRFSASLLETLWAYAHFTGDWDLIKERWGLVKKLFCTTAETCWAGFGREGIAELGDEAAPCLALARMAYKVGDLDTYNYACYMFARELVHQYVQQRGAPYFRLHQPWHSMEFMDEEVYLTNLSADVGGWQLDGPNYPAKTGERQYNNRWVGFKNEDVARFYRDYLAEDVRRELDLLGARRDTKRIDQGGSRTIASGVELRSLLLNETPAQLAALGAPDQFTGPPCSVIARCISVLRTSHPTRYQRLIPGSPPSPFVTGLEREVAGPNPFLVQAPQTVSEDKNSGTNQSVWPEVARWKNWQTPTGHRWTLGLVTPLRGGAAPASHSVSLNWNTRAVVY